MKTMRVLASIAAIAIFGAGPALASETEDLTAKLQAFLSQSDLEFAHEGFWAHDLIYTSSDGSRFGKREIMEGFQADPDAGDAEDAESSMSYSGEEVDIRLYGDMAIVAFKLVGTPLSKGADDALLYYFNTGTFLKREGTWQVVAWQATKIPPPEK